MLFRQTPCVSPCHWAGHPVKKHIISSDCCWKLIQSFWIFLAPFSVFTWRCIHLANPDFSVSPPAHSHLNDSEWIWLHDHCSITGLSHSQMSRSIINPWPRNSAIMCSYLSEWLTGCQKCGKRGQKLNHLLVVFRNTPMFIAWSNFGRQNLHLLRKK